jgi:hypothetical protein
MAAQVFLSYVRENALLVDRLKRELEACGIVTWLDRSDLPPGKRWKIGIRRAIRRASFFIACFSAQYCQRIDTWMNEELNLAIDRLRQRHIDSAWLIPVKLTPCELPELDIGGGQLLSDLQCVELYSDWELGVSQLAAAILARQPVNSPTASSPTASAASTVTPTTPPAKDDKKTTVKINTANSRRTIIRNPARKSGQDGTDSHLSVEIGTNNTDSLIIN